MVFIVYWMCKQLLAYRTLVSTVFVPSLRMLHNGG